MFLYYTRGLVRWVGGVYYGDMGAMKAEGQARLEPPRNPGYAYTGYCVLAVGYVESGVVGFYEYAAVNGLRGVTGTRRLHGGGGTRTTESPLKLMRLRTFKKNNGESALASPHACCFVPWLPLCAGQRSPCFLLVAMLLQCCGFRPLTPGEQTGQPPSLLLMLTLCCCHCPQSLVDRYPLSSGSSVMLWATSGSPGTNGIERGRNHLSARDAR